MAVCSKDYLHNAECFSFNLLTDQPQFANLRKSRKTLSGFDVSRFGFWEFADIGTLSFFSNCQVFVSDSFSAGAGRGAWESKHLYYIGWQPATLLKVDTGRRM